MEAVITYLLKASGILVLFYGTYHILLKKETFFAGNRYFLLGGILSTFLLPLMYINRYITLSLAVKNPTLQSQFAYSLPDSDTGFGWQLLLMALYGGGVFLLFSKFLWQLISLTTLLRKNKVRKEQGFVYVETAEPIAPFSFFNYIVYNPVQYTREELDSILVHERAHCSQWHSMDILVAELAAILLWINPVAWLYRKNIKQNLEFLADAKATRHIPSSLKVYQQTLLKVSGIQVHNSITNNFYNSLIKKRIIMLQKSKSKPLHSLKYALVIPFLAAFILMFNTRVVAQHAEQPGVHKDQDHENMRIHKEMTDSDLSALKREVKDKTGGILSYSGIKRNLAGDISQIKIEYRDNNGNSANAMYDENEGIPTVYFGGTENGGIYIANYESKAHGQSGNNTVLTLEENGKEAHSGSHTIKIKKIGDKQESKMVRLDSGDGERRKVEITEINEKKTIKINGKEVSEAELEAMEKEEGEHKKGIRIKRLAAGQNKNVMIIREFENEEDDIDIEVISEEGTGYFFIDSEGSDNTIFTIDGKESTREEVGALSPDMIEKLEVLEGEKEVSKYGEKAKDGIIVEITNKKRD